MLRLNTVRCMPESSFRESLIVESKDSTKHKMILARSIAHEITRQWFNNVSPKWWSDLWLSEGFASFFELHILDQVASCC